MRCWRARTTFSILLTSRTSQRNLSDICSIFRLWQFEKEGVQQWEMFSEVGSFFTKWIDSSAEDPAQSRFTRKAQHKVTSEMIHVFPNDFFSYDLHS